MLSIDKYLVYCIQMMPQLCSNSACNREISYWQHNCKCGASVGFPNNRAAKMESLELEDRYQQALKTSRAKGTCDLITSLEHLVEDAQPVICMSVLIADDVMRDKKYRNYHHLVDLGNRDPAHQEDDSVRTMVGARLFPHFFDKIHYASLSIDGKGLKNYGTIALEWRVTDIYLEGRISVHEENSFDFFDNHSLGDRKINPPKGYSSEWSERHKIAVSKLARKIDVNTTQDDLSELILHSGEGRSQDDFIEIAIYSEDGIDKEDVDCVTLQNKVTERGEHLRLMALKETCEKIGVKFVG